MGVLQLDGKMRNVDKAGIIIFIVNVLLWIDFNLTIRRQKRQREPPGSRRRFVLQGRIIMVTTAVFIRMTLLMLRGSEAYLEDAPLELLGGDANPTTFALTMPIICSIMWGRCR